MKPIRVLAISAVVAMGMAAFACAEGGADNDGGDAAASRAISGETHEDALAPAATAAADTASSYGASGGSGDGDGSAPVLPSQADRKVIFSAEVRLEADDVRAAFDSVGRIATSYAGYMEGSTFSGSEDDEDSPPSASMTIRVPAVSYQQALADIRGISGVTVSEESAHSAEVTEEYTDLESRLRNLERTEQQYLDLMAKAVTVDEILALTDRLDGVRLQIEQVQGRTNYLNSLTDLATIAVSIASIPPAAVTSDGSTGIGEAFADAWEWSLEAARNLAIASAYVLVAVGWLAIPAALVLLVARRMRRRHEAAAAEGLAGH